MITISIYNHTFAPWKGNVMPSGGLLETSEGGAKRAKGKKKWAM